MEFITTLFLLTLSIFINAIIIGSIGFFITNSIRKKVTNTLLTGG